MEKSKEEYFPGPNQEGGGEEDDGAVDVRRHHREEEEKHQDLQRDSGGQVGEIHTNRMFSMNVCICIQLKKQKLNVQNTSRVMENWKTKKRMYCLFWFLLVGTKVPATPHLSRSPTEKM